MCTVLPIPSQKKTSPVMTKSHLGRVGVANSPSPTQGRATATRNGPKSKRGGARKHPGLRSVKAGPPQSKSRTSSNGSAPRQKSNKSNNSTINSTPGKSTAGDQSSTKGNHSHSHHVTQINLHRSYRATGELQSYTSNLVNPILLIQEPYTDKHNLARNVPRSLKCFGIQGTARPRVHKNMEERCWPQE